MIHVSDAATLGPSERHGLDLLIDLSRVARADDVARAGVELRVVEREARDPARFAPDVFGVHDGVVELPRGVLQWVTDIGGAAIEQRCDARDRFGRVPADATPVVIAGKERVPIVSICARALREAAKRAAGTRPFRMLAPWPDGKRWAVSLTHDLDAVVAWPVFTALRLGELARKGELRRTGRTVTAAIAAVGRSPLRRAAFDLLDLERRLGVRGTWFVLAGTPTLRTMRAGDLTYAIDSAPARRILERVQAHAHEIALHGSFETFDDGGRFQGQRARLERVTGAPVHGVRQHYLRLQPGATPSAMSRAGFRYDSTFGFADRNGFRLGIADVVPLWDARSASSLPIVELPFVWMDRALSKYRGIEEPDAWIDDALELATAARAVEGVWTGVWHPNLVAPLGFPDAPAAYERLVRSLLAASPWIATAGEIVAWRTRRRNTRIRGVRPDGRIDAIAPVLETSGEVLHLETADGRAAELVVPHG